MEIATLDLQLSQALPTLVLKDLHNERSMVLFIDYDYVELLNEGLKQEMPEPDGMMKTWLDSITALGGHLLRAEIFDYTDETYQACVIVRRQDGSENRISSPVGFALSAALYSGVSVFVKEDIIEQNTEMEFTPDEADDLMQETGKKLMDKFNSSYVSKYKM